MEDKATIFLDNQSTVHLCKNPAFNERTKHVNVRYHFIRENVTKGNILVDKISTEDNPTNDGEESEVEFEKALEKYVQKDHPIDQIIGDKNKGVQTKRIITVDTWIVNNI